MRTKNHSSGRTGAASDEPEINTAGLWLGVTDGNLETKVKQAFDLARSAGRELDLTFNSGGPAHDALGQPHLPQRRPVTHLKLMMSVRR